MTYLTIKAEQTIFDDNQVCVVIDGWCNHAATTSYYIDRNGEEVFNPSDSVWTSEEKVCDRCGATQVAETEEWFNEVLEETK